MAKLTKEEAKKIVSKELKGYRIASEQKVDSDASASKTRPDAATPDLAELRKKYLKGTDTSTDEVPNGSDANAMEDMIVAVEPDNPADPWSHSARPKAKVISGSKKTIIGSQG